MSKLFIRIIVLLLIPWLVVDPAMAASLNNPLSSMWKSENVVRNEGATSSFLQQAFSPPAVVGAEHPDENPKIKASINVDAGTKLGMEDDLKQFRSALSKRLAAIRESQGLSQADLGVLSDVDEDLISQIESGWIGVALSTWSRLAVGLRISLGELLDVRQGNPIPVPQRESPIIPTPQQIAENLRWLAREKGWAQRTWALACLMHEVSLGVILNKLAAGKDIFLPDLFRLVRGLNANMPEVLQTNPHDPLPPLSVPRKIAYDMLSELTSRQKEIVNLVQEGLSNKEAAAKLEIEEQTVKEHLRQAVKRSKTRNEQNKHEADAELASQTLRAA